MTAVLAANFGDPRRAVSDRIDAVSSTSRRYFCRLARVDQHDVVERAQAHVAPSLGAFQLVPENP